MTRYLQLIIILVTSSRVCSFRLVDSGGGTITDESLGLLLYNGGTVCDDKFSDNSAHAICKEMGFYSAISWESSSDPYTWPVQMSYSIQLDNVECTYPHWNTCTYTTDDNCSHGEDIFLSCSQIAMCPSGMYAGGILCRWCPPNTYSSSPGFRKSCTSCPTSSTSSSGSVYCICKAGMYWDSDIDRCESCYSGSASHQGALQCVRCPGGSSAVINDGASCSCTAGMSWRWDSLWYGLFSGSCRFCSPGTYKNEQSQECTICPQGSTSTVGSNHCICPAGKFWDQDECRSCEPGTASLEGALQCPVCPPGSAADLGGTSCLCPWGRGWVWSEDRTGSCRIPPLGLTNVIILCMSGALVLICFTLTLLQILQRKKKQKTSNKVVYRRDCDNVEIQGNQERGSDRRDGVVDEIEVYHNIEADEDIIYSNLDEL